MQLNFENPWALLGVFGPALLAFVMIYQRRKKPISFSRRRLLLVFFGLLCCVLGLARPQAGQTLTETQAVRSNVFFAMDVSESMLARDVSPSRLQFAINFARKLLDKLAGTKVAIYPFALNGYIQMPLTTDTAAAADMISALNPTFMSHQGTDLSLALETLLQNIEKMERQGKNSGVDWFPTQVILFSDGETHWPLREETLRQYRTKKIPIFTVATGTTTGATIPSEGRFGPQRNYLKDRQGNVVKTFLSADVLQKISRATGGDYVPSHFEEVDRLAKRLTQSIHVGKLSTRFTISREFYPLFFAIALVLFLIELIFARWEYAIRVIMVALMTYSHALSAEEPSEPWPDILIYNQGLDSLKKGDLEKAASQFQESAAITQNKVIKKKSLFNQGNTLLKQADPQQALQVYQQAYDTQSEDEGFDREANKLISDNMELAAKILEQMKKQGTGDGESSSSEDQKPGKTPKDSKGPQRFKKQRFTEGQKQKIYDLLASEEQQIIQQLQSRRNKKAIDRFVEKPW